MSNTNPSIKANWFSKIFLWHSVKLFRRCGNKNKNILYDVLDEDSSKTMGDYLECKWQEEMKKAKDDIRSPSLARAMWGFQFQHFRKTTLLIIIDLMCRLSEPYLVGIIISYFNPDSVFVELDVYISAFALIFVTSMSAIIQQHVSLIGSHVALKAKVACSSLIFRKLLQLNHPALNHGTVGKLINLLTNDVSKLENIFTVLQNSWLAVIFTGIIVYIIWCQVEKAALIAVACIILLLFIQSYCGYLITKFRRETSGRTDERVRLMDEVISGIKVIKMHMWEKQFASTLLKARKLEIKSLQKRYFIQAFLSGLNWCLSRVVFFFVLFFLVFQNHNIPSAKVYVTVLFLNFLLNNGQCMWMVFTGIMDISECWITIHRIQEFLLEAELISKSTFPLKLNFPAASNEREAVIFEEASVACTPGKNILTNINFSIEHGQLIAIVGAVGSGKTSLLLSILGELPLSAGKMVLSGKVSYASQEPWILGCSIRDNIVLGKTYDKNRYNRAVKVCDLNKDFNQFQYGDLTIVGERGATLSGGQKARVNLARAIYNEADIYLLDDPLSAVDVNVGKHLYEHCIIKHLAAKTRLLVTQQAHYLKDADVIFIINNGTIEISGTFEMLIKQKKYANLFCSEECDIDTPASRYSTLSYYSWKRKYSTISKKSEIFLMGVDEDVSTGGYNSDGFLPQTKKNGLFLQYITAGNSWIFLVIVTLLFILSQMLMTLGDYWLSVMTKQDTRNSEDQINGIIYNFLREHFNQILSDSYASMCVYSGLIFSHLVSRIISNLLFFVLCMRSCEKLHNIVLDKIMHGKMKFFDSNSSGEILNRFSKDMGVMDESLPKWILDVEQILMFAVSSFVVSALVNYLYIVPVLIIAVPFCFIVRIYICTANTLRHVEAKTKSPVLMHINTTLQGLSSIHAYNAEESFKQKFDEAQDKNSSANYMITTARCAHGLWLSILNNVYTACIIIGFLVFRNAASEGSEVGLVITQSLMLNKFLQFGMKQFAEVTIQLIAVERIAEYSTIQQEEEDKGKNKLNIEWVQSGQIDFHSVSMKYVDTGPDVISGLALTIQPGEKVGVVGRTGAGKSSLLSAILQLAEYDGTICVDGIDTKSMRLDELRRGISVIPQDPVLFSGTLRYNLDPCNLHTESELLNVLKDIEMLNPATNYILPLETKVSDGGYNFSIGEKQMICLARAILRNNKILIADEATANVDLRTESVIHDTIRRKFKDCTVITIAHRLGTVMDCDKILVMDKGAAMEYDHPYMLLKNKNGHLYTMIKRSDSTVLKQLIKIAKLNFERSQGQL